MLPTSLPGGIPSGITAALPTSPRAASFARFGIAAASNGVRPPSSSIGSSAHPSGTQITYFTGSSFQGAGGGGPGVGGGGLVALGEGREVGRVGGERGAGGGGFDGVGELGGVGGGHADDRDGTADGAYRAGGGHADRRVGVGQVAGAAV